MLSCREVARLATQSLVHKLAWHQRMSLRVHMALCSVCRRSARNMALLRSYCAKLRDPESMPATPLPDEARERIKQNLSGPPEGLGGPQDHGTTGPQDH